MPSSLPILDKQSKVLYHREKEFFAVPGVTPDKPDRKILLGFILSVMFQTETNL